MPSIRARKRLDVNVRCVGYALKRLGVSYKKTLSHHRACAAKRRIFQEKINHYKDAGRPIIYIDESGFSQDMPRTHGYAEKGKRCYGK